jgi:hypothetical protein
MACPCSSVTVTHQVERGLRAAAAARSRARSGSIGPVPRKTLSCPAISVSVVTGAVRWIRTAIAPLGPLAGPLPALLLPQAANPYPMYRTVVTEHSIL